MDNHSIYDLVSLKCWPFFLWETESNLFLYVFKTNTPLQMPPPLEEGIQNKHLMDFSHVI